MNGFYLPRNNSKIALDCASSTDAADDTLKPVLILLDSTDLGRPKYKLVLQVRIVCPASRSLARYFADLHIYRLTDQSSSLNLKSSNRRTYLSVQPAERVLKLVDRTIHFHRGQSCPSFGYDYRDYESHPDRPWRLARS